MFPISNNYHLDKMIKSAKLLISGEFECILKYQGDIDLFEQLV